MKRRRADREPDGKKGLREKAAELLGMPTDALGVTDGFMAELRGKNGITVKGCRRILTYSETRITLDTRDGAVTVLGSSLACYAYFHGAVGIEGRVYGVFFTECRRQISDALSEGLCETEGNRCEEP